MMIGVLPYGPTAMFNVCLIVAIIALHQISNYTSADSMKKITKYESNIDRPAVPLSEVFVSRFKSRLARRLSRLFCSLLAPKVKEEEEQQVPSNLITFHNQRDFIFFRHHEMDPSTADKHEVGPRFTLKIAWLRAGRMDDDEGTEFCSRRFKVMRKSVGWKRKFIL